MNIQTIYQQYSIPINLQQHMFRVAALGSIVCDSLVKIKIDKFLVVKTLLLHDMGNILKFDFVRLDLLVEEDRARVDQLKAAQKIFRKKYGKNPDVATLKIMRELKLDQNIIDLCQASHWELIHQFLGSNFWDRKICAYADMRIGPFGIMPLLNRLNDLMIRRPHEKEKLILLSKQGLNLEKQLQKASKKDLQKISDKDIKKQMSELECLEI